MGVQVGGTRVPSTSLPHLVREDEAVRTKIAILLVLLSLFARAQIASVTCYFGGASPNDAFLRVPSFMDGQPVCGKKL